MEFEWRPGRVAKLCSDMREAGKGTDMNNKGEGVSRRGFIFGISAAVGGLVLTGLPSLAESTGVVQSPLLTNAPGSEVGIWVVIDGETTTIRVARSEMGQGNFTALPMLVAEELDCDWSHVTAEYVLPEANLAHGHAWGDMMTASSASIRMSHLYLRKAGAQARHMLVDEAAARWKVSALECTARDSVVTHAASGRSLTYGELAENAARRPVPQEVTLKDPNLWRLIGTPVKRLDLEDKVLAKPIFATDVRLPDMLYATVTACPTLGGRLKDFDASKTLVMPGVRHVVPVGDTAVAIVADSWWQAHHALDTLLVRWDAGPAAALSNESIREIFLKGLDDPHPAVAQRIGNVDEVLANATNVIHADYEVPYLAHTTMEPQTCTAHVTPEFAEVWAPTQNGDGTLQVVAHTLKIDPSRVKIHKCHLGGGFGRRGVSQDWAQQAVLIARAVGKPVKMLWTREEDVRHDYYRPMSIARHVAGFDRNGKLLAWKVRLSCTSILANLMPSRLRHGQDFDMMGAFLPGDMSYHIPNFEVGYAMRQLPIPVGFWRGVNHSQNGFFRESFVDEMAHASGQDPYAFRRELLAHSPRSLAVVDEVATRAQWGHTKAGTYQGMALVECYDSVCAHVVDLSIDDEGRVKVHRVVCALDCGYVVNPSIVKKQLQGAVAYALSAVLWGQVTIKNGEVQQSNFHDYPALRISEMPVVETYLIPSGNKYIDRWGGVGEPGTPPVAPAVVNAIFAATGKRIRLLPLAGQKLV